MPFAPPPPDYPTTRPAIVAFSTYRELRYGGGLPLPFDVTRRAFDGIRFGQNRYTLRRVVTGVFAPSTTGTAGEFRVEGFPPMLAGVGRKPDEAYHDWVEQFHTTFQRLYAMRPFEMTADDLRTWGTIEGVVDVEKYRLSQPLIVRQIGRVTKGRPHPLVITWEDGTCERVHLERMPGEFVTYKAGQPFEAVVHRDPVTHKLLSVEYLKRLSEGRVGEAERRELWDSAPTSAILPDADWD